MRSPWKFAENKREQNYKRRKTQYHKRQRVVAQHHGNYYARYDYAVFRKHDYYVGKQTGDGFGIVADARNQFSHGYFVQLSVRQMFDMIE